MHAHELQDEFSTRLTLYGLDERARQRLQQLWAVIEPQLAAAVDDFVTESLMIAHVAPIYRAHRETIRETVLAHYRALLCGRFDRAYADACMATLRQHAAIGLEARARLFAGNCVLRRASTAIARRYWFSAATVDAYVKIVTQAIMFDLAITITLHQKFTEQEREDKRRQVDQ